MAVYGHKPRLTNPCPRCGSLADGVCDTCGLETHEWKIMQAGRRLADDLGLPVGLCTELMGAVVATVEGVA